LESKGRASKPQSSPKANLPSKKGEEFQLTLRQFPENLIKNHLQHVFQGLGRHRSIRIFEGRCKLITNWQNFSINDGLSPTFGLENSWKKYDLLEPFGR